MAVEKLILKSIYHVVDKIPDSWFDLLPGGYYRDAQGHTHKRGDKYDRDTRARSQQGSRKARFDDFYPDDRYASGRGRRGRRRSRGRRSTSSYDGNDDSGKEYYYERSGRRSRRRSEGAAVRDDGREDDYDPMHSRYSYDRGDKGNRDNRSRRARSTHDDPPSTRAHCTPHESQYTERWTTGSGRRSIDKRDLPPQVIAMAREMDRTGSFPQGGYPNCHASSYPPPPIRDRAVNSDYMPYADIYSDLHRQRKVYADHKRDGPPHQPNPHATKLPSAMRYPQGSSQEQKYDAAIPTVETHITEHIRPASSRNREQRDQERYYRHEERLSPAHRASLSADSNSAVVGSRSGHA